MNDMPKALEAINKARQDVMDKAGMLVAKALDQTEQPKKAKQQVAAKRRKVEAAIAARDAFS